MHWTEVRSQVCGIKNVGKSVNIGWNSIVVRRSSYTISNRHKRDAHRVEITTED